MLVNYLEIPIYVQLMNGPADADLFFKSCEPTFYSPQYNLQRQFVFRDQPEEFFLYRMQNFLTVFLQKTWLKWRLEYVSYQNMNYEETKFIHKKRY